MLSIHSNIASLRRMKDLSQKEFARLLKVSRRAVVGWETGGAVPRKGHLLEIARVLSVTVERLFGAAA